MAASPESSMREVVSDKNNPNDDQNTSEKASKVVTDEGSKQNEQQQLALPAAGSDGASQPIGDDSSGEVRHTLRFDSLGPLVVNRNGTLSRIENWAQMTGAERERTIRVLGKRNMLRMEAVMKEEGLDAQN